MAKPRTPDAVCDVSSCDSPRTLRKWCRRHYSRWLRYGDPEAGYRSPGAPLPPCKVKGCTRRTPRVIRGWCEMHYSRWATTGDVGSPDGRIRGDDAARFAASYVVDEHGCWLWQRGKTSSGYGAFSYSGGRSAHVWSYQQHVGPIPDGHEIDHLCAVPACVNPAHLEAVTHEENMRRVALRRPVRDQRETNRVLDILLDFAQTLGRDADDLDVQAAAVAVGFRIRDPKMSDTRATVTA